MIEPVISQERKAVSGWWLLAITGTVDAILSLIGAFQFELNSFAWSRELGWVLFYSICFGASVCLAAICTVKGLDPRA